MRILDKIFGGNERSEKPKYSFDLINNSLLREDRNKIAELITKVDAVQNTEEKMGPWTELTNFVSDCFAGVGVSADEESIASFIKTFARLPQKPHYSEATPQPVPQQVEKPMQDDSTEIDLASRVMPTRVIRQNEFDNLEPITSAPTMTPEVFSAQQRGLGVTASPEVLEAQGEKYMADLIAEAQLNESVAKGSDAKFVPHPGDIPQYEAKNDSVPGNPNTDWILPNHKDAIHPKPPEHLIK